MDWASLFMTVTWMCVFFVFDHLDPTIFLPSNRGPDMLKNVMSTNKRIKIEKLEHDLNDFLIQYFVVRCHFSSQFLL